MNLLSNAVKFTPPGGTVTVFARSLPSGELELGVHDTGEGIDPADIDAVFASFGRGRHDITSTKKGTGLGLPIVKGLVEAHGGKVLLQSELGRGTSIACRFPRERVTATQPAPMRATVTP
jgi:two-component system cell cycle sensor histidine kinase PleC